MLFTEISRKQAFLAHLGVSMLIFFVLAYLIVFQWYPSYYFDLDGGDRGLLTIFFVDVVLGPGLTLLVFKQGKKGLKFDVTMILLFQLIALSWGVKSVYTARPALTAFYDGVFSCVAEGEVAADTMSRLVSESSERPLLTFLRRPDVVDEYMNFVGDALKVESSEIYYYQDRLEVVDEDNIDRIRSYVLDVEEGIEKADQREEVSLKNWQDYRESNPPSDDIAFYPMKCRYKVGMAVFDLSRRKIIDHVDVYTRKPASTIQLKPALEPEPDHKEGQAG